MKVTMILRKIKRTIIGVFLTVKRRLHIKKLNKKRKQLLEQLKEKDHINVVFFALSDAAWKCDSLYRKMQEDSRFKPTILICPTVNYGYENMINRMADCSLFYEKKGYPYLLAYDKEKKEYLDVRKELKPDIIFYLNPYKGLIHDNYSLDKFDDVLTCYIPYFYESGNGEMFFNLDFHNYVWRYYVESDSLKKEQEIKLKRKRDNVVPVGFCPFDEFKEVKERLSRNNGPINIIWAPHHLIDQNFAYVRDGFFKYHNLFFELADKYNGKVHFIFRPHPLLKNKLEQLESWGPEKTMEYYQKWNQYPNCSIEEHTNYIELFINSDALIHDCGSFMAEYLYVDKPALFTDKEVFTTELYWQSAIDVMECYYRADSKDEVKEFIDEVVINHKDPKKILREDFIKQQIHPENDVAQNIINDILDSIANQKLY